MKIIKNSVLKSRQTHARNVAIDSNIQKYYTERRELKNIEDINKLYRLE